MPGLKQMFMDYMKPKPKKKKAAKKRKAEGGYLRHLGAQKKRQAMLDKAMQD